MTTDHKHTDHYISKDETIWGYSPITPRLSDTFLTTIIAPTNHGIIYKAIHTLLIKADRDSSRDDSLSRMHINGLRLDTRGHDKHDLLLMNGFTIGNLVHSLLELLSGIRVSKLDNVHAFNRVLQLLCGSSPDEPYETTSDYTIRLWVPKPYTKATKKKRGTNDVVTGPMNLTIVSDDISNNFYIKVDLVHTDALTTLPMIANVIILLGLLISQLTKATYNGYLINVGELFINRLAISNLPCVLDHGQSDGVIVNDSWSSQVLIASGINYQKLRGSFNMESDLLGALQDRLQTAKVIFS